MSADIKALLEAQYDIHGRMSRFMDNLRKMGVSNITRDVIQARIGILDNLWNKVEAQHELIRTTLKKKYQKCEYAKLDFIDVAENTYIAQRNTLSGYAEKLKGEAPTASKSEPSERQAPRISLPRIKLQTLSGAYADWPAFLLIHNRRQSFSLQRREVALSPPLLARTCREINPTITNNRE